MLLFHYPSSQSAGFDYLKRSVKLQFGSLTDQQPVGQHPIRPWIAEELPQAFSDWKCEVVALELARSFREKVTILHAEFHRPVTSSTPDRFSRHYADAAALATHPIASLAINQNALRDRVVDWKSRFFGSTWASYATAKPGTFRLVPPESRQDALRRDNQAMQIMYLSKAPSFDVIIEALAELEAWRGNPLFSQLEDLFLKIQPEE